jgi:glycosyltransferase involved in cell wall biosynthesis
MAEPRPRVAIILRTRDRPVLLRRALADVCAQTFQDWQLVVVNDGGDAEEVERLLAEQKALADRTTVLHHPRSVGRPAAWNRGLQAADAEYVAVHDDDDTWHPTFLQRTVAHLEGTAEVAVAARTEIVWERLDGDDVVEQGREPFFPDLPAVTLFDLIRTNRVVPIALLYRRSVHDEIGPVREDLPVVEDWEFNLRLAAAHPIALLDGPPLAFWHQRREAEGALANSVIELDGEHRAEDLKVRDEALREHVGRYGAGALLYVTSYFQREFDHVHGRFEVGENLTREALAALARQAEQLERQAEQLRRLEHRLDGRSASAGPARRAYRRLRAALTR